MIEPRDAPYPELKKRHTMTHTGRPYTDFKPPPAAPVWAAIDGFGRYHLLLAALELGVFDALQSSGPCPSAAFAGRLEASAPHVRALLDGLVVMGLLDQVGGLYDLNDTARRYLVSDGPASMADLIPVAPGPHDNWRQLANTIRTGRPSTPIDDDPAAFYVPLVEGTFTTMLRCASRADLKMRYSTTPAARVLDLGAGGAPWTIAMLQACPEATATVNDFDAVLDVARRTTALHGVIERCTFRAGNYFDIEIETGAYDIAVLGHVCRAEGAAGAKRLIERAFASLAPGGRLVLADYFCDPEHRVNSHAVLMGATMMASTLNGFTYTTDEFGEWLRSAGFVDLRLIEPIGFQTCIVATGPRERSFE